MGWCLRKLEIVQELYQKGEFDYDIRVYKALQDRYTAYYENILEVLC